MEHGGERPLLYFAGEGGGQPSESQGFESREVDFPGPLRGYDVWIQLAGDGEIFEVWCVIEDIVEEVDASGPVCVGIMPPFETS